MMFDELNEDAYLNMSIFDAFNEADNDDTAGNDAGGNDATGGGDDAAGGNDDNSNNRDEDFDIDADLDTGDDDNAGDDTGGTDDTGTDDTTDDSGSDISGGDAGNGEEEPVEANTDIFSSLTAEEQAIKIRELKNLFNNLYTSIDDNITKLDNLGTTEDNIQAVTKLTTCMYNLKTYISDYIQFIFPNKSYIENDISFNRFLAIIKSITTIMNDLYKKMEEGDDKNQRADKNYQN